MRTNGTLLINLVDYLGPINMVIVLGQVRLLVWNGYTHEG